MGQKFLMVMLGGSLGSASRFILSLLMVRWVGPDFAWGTLTVNLAGCSMNEPEVNFRLIIVH